MDDPENKGTQFPKLLKEINEDCFLIIAEHWSAHDLLHIEEVWPQLTDRVSLAFTNCEECTLMQDTIDRDRRRDQNGLAENAFRAVFETLLRCGNQLRRVFVPPHPLESDVQEYRRLMRRLAAQCPNIERFVEHPATLSNAVAQTNIDIVFDYVDALEGNCSLQSLTLISESLERREHLELLFCRILTKCDQIRELNFIFDNGSYRVSEQVTAAITEYSKKPLVRQVEKITYHQLKLDDTNFDDAIRFSATLFASFRNVHTADVKLTCVKVSPDHGFMRPAKLATLISTINSHPKIKKLHLNCNLGLLNLSSV